MSASASSSEVIYYTSLYRHGVDEKRRVQIPAKWRPADASIEFTLILWPKGTMLEACLLVLPPAEWDALVKKLKELPFADPKAQELRRTIGRNSDRVTVDKSGRICLPEEMAKAAAIDDRAVLLGMVDRFEIWNPERYQEMSAADTDERLLDVFRQI